jgi:multiple sugar transport system ATP-binding protein
MPEIVLKNITKRFGQAGAVENLNLTIGDGDFITLLGPSGCGKTTTLRMIAGLETPTEGQIYIDGKLVFDAAQSLDISPDKRGVGFLFQNYALWPHMTVAKNISFGLENLKWDAMKIKSRVETLLATLHIEDFSNRYPSELSGGQQQRVAIARTLAPNPQVLLMDEPLSNLDAKLRMEMRTELKRLHMETHSTFVYVTHDQLEAMTLSTKVCLLKKGVLQQYSPPLEIYGKPVNTFTADFVGNPGINLIPFTANGKAGDRLKISNEDMALEFTSQEGSVDVPEGKKLVLGLRPEMITLGGEGCLKGQVYSSLPSGMETIVRIHVGKTPLLSVVFGSIDFAVNESTRVSIDSDRYLLFDGDTGERIAIGKLTASVISQ